MSNQAPNAPIQNSPVGSVVVDYAYIQRFNFTYSNVDPTDTQSAFDIQYRVVGAGAWTTINAVTPNNFYDLAAGTLTANNYEWQVRAYDAIGIVGPWSASAFFTASTAPALPTITAPTSGSTVSVAPTFTWAATSQSSYRIRRVRDVAGSPDTGTVYWDSGEVVGSAVRSVVLAMDTNNRYEHLQLLIKNAGVWSASWASIRVLVSYTQPSPGVVSVAGSDALGALLITTTAAAVGVGEPTPIYVDIYVRVAGTVGFGDRIATKRLPTDVFTWYSPISGVAYEVRTLTMADNGTQRWSLFFYYHFVDGGPAVAGPFSINLDGGHASTAFTNHVDGGTP